jgi:uncharacterized protein (DUF885 family)
MRQSLRNRLPHGRGSVSAVLLTFFIMTSCKQPAAPAKPDLMSLTDDFVYGSLALSPSSATSAGYHQHKGVNLDDQLDDFSAAGIDQQHKFYSDFHNRLAAIQQDALSAEDRADYQIIFKKFRRSCNRAKRTSSMRRTFGIA